MPQFVKDVEEIRQRALQKIEDGAVTQAYRGNKEHTIGILNEALATEIVCVLRYMHHYFMATGVHGKSVSAEFKEHADAEREHADQIAERIQQLGGKPDFNPRSLMERSASQYVEGETLADMIREDLVAERMVIEVYTDMIRHFGDNDPTTRVMIEGILKDEEEHASDLTDLMYIVDPRTGESEGQDPGTNPLEIGGNGRGQEQERGRDTRAQGQKGQQQHQGREGSQQRNPRGQQQQRAEHRGGRQSQQQQQRDRQSQSGDGSPDLQEDPNQGRNRGQQSRRGGPPVVSQRQAGTTFAGSDKPNPPQPIRNRERNQQKGQRPGNGGNQPLQPSYFQGEGEQQQREGGQQGRQRQEQFGGRGSAGVERQGNRGDRSGRRKGAA
jgi:bacterioferritin